MPSISVDNNCCLSQGGTLRLSGEANSIPVLHKVVSSSERTLGARSSHRLRRRPNQETDFCYTECWSANCSPAFPTQPGPSVCLEAGPVKLSKHYCNTETTLITSPAAKQKESYTKASAQPRIVLSSIQISSSHL